LRCRIVIVFPQGQFTRSILPIVLPEQQAVEGLAGDQHDPDPGDPRQDAPADHPPHRDVGHAQDAGDLERREHRGVVGHVS
jgi:hypothetical protein